MRQYADCASCGDDFHIDDEDIYFCNKCNCYVCFQCCDVDDEKNVTRCDNCEEIELEETKNKIQDAKLQSLIDDVNELHKLCLKKHRDEVERISDNVISWLNKLKSK